MTATITFTVQDDDPELLAHAASEDTTTELALVDILTTAIDGGMFDELKAIDKSEMDIKITGQLGGHTFYI